MEFCELLVPEPGELDPADRGARRGRCRPVAAAGRARQCAARLAVGRCGSRAQAGRAITSAAASTWRPPAAQRIVGGPLYGAPLVFAGRPPAPIDEARRASPHRSGWSTACSAPAQTPPGRDVRFAIEPLNRFETDFCNTASQAVASARQRVDSPAVGVMLDTFHMNMEEDDLRRRSAGRPAADPFPGQREPSRLPRHRPYRLARDLPRAGRDQLSRRHHAGAVPPHRPPLSCRWRSGGRRRTTRTPTSPSAQLRRLCCAAHSSMREAIGDEHNDPHRLDRLWHACQRNAAAAARPPGRAACGAMRHRCGARLDANRDRYGVTARYDRRDGALLAHPRAGRDRHGRRARRSTRDSARPRWRAACRCSWKSRRRRCRRVRSAWPTRRTRRQVPVSSAS